MSATLVKLPLGLLIAALPPCAFAQPLDCGRGQDAGSVVELFFGRNIGKRLGVSEAAWSRFLAREITPRFPDGLTVINASGQWRDPVRSTIVHEPTKLVLIILRDAAAAQERVDAVVAAYKARFRQQSVALVVRPACVAF
jgi:hypothetical protein